MDIQALSDMEKRALAQISVVVYGEELARIMMPELGEYLNVSSPSFELAAPRPDSAPKA